MRSVAQDFDEEDRATLAAMSPAERVALALRLGERDLEAFARARGLSLPQARRLLEHQRQLGRTPSRCMTAPHDERP